MICDLHSDFLEKMHDSLKGMVMGCDTFTPSSFVYAATHG